MWSYYDLNQLFSNLFIQIFCIFSPVLQESLWCDDLWSSSMLNTVSCFCGNFFFLLWIKVQKSSIYLKHLHGHFLSNLMGPCWLKVLISFTKILLTPIFWTVVCIHIWQHLCAFWFIAIHLIWSQVPALKTLRKRQRGLGRVEIVTANKLN